MEVIYKSLVDSSVKSYIDTALSVVKQFLSYFKERLMCRVTLLPEDKAAFGFFVKSLYLVTYRVPFSFYTLTPDGIDIQQSDQLSLPVQNQAFQTELIALYHQANNFRKAFIVPGAPGFIVLSVNGKKFSEQDMTPTLMMNLQEFVNRYDNESKCKRVTSRFA